MASVPTPPGFDALWERFPWPAEPPVPDAPLTGRDSSGFEFMKSVLDARGRETPVIMEIGAEFGGSTRKFLGFDDRVHVVSVDPWPDTYGGGSFPEIRPFLGGPDGMYRLFQTFMFDHRDRLATVRAYSPAGPLIVHDAGVEVDLIYVDGDHRYDAVIRDVTVARSLFPEAAIAGDDWLFNPSHKKYEGIRHPVQTAVLRYAAVNNVAVETDGDTWVLNPAERFNKRRPVPRFGGAPAPAAAPTGSLGEDEIKERLRVVERSVKELLRLTRDTPSRRVARRVRSLVNHDS